MILSRVLSMCRFHSKAFMTRLLVTFLSTAAVASFAQLAPPRAVRAQERRFAPTRAGCEAVREKALYDVMLQNMELDKVLGLMADVTCKKFVLVGDSKGTISVSSPAQERLGAGPFYAAFLRALETNSLAAVDDGIQVFVGPKARSIDKAVKSSDAVKQTSERSFEVQAAEFHRLFDKRDEASVGARIVPAFRDGVAEGFKVFSIRADSMLVKLGIQNGDLIKRVNEYDMNSPEKTLEVYSKLKGANRVEVELERSGAIIKNTYLIR